MYHSHSCHHKAHFCPNSMICIPKFFRFRPNFYSLLVNVLSSSHLLLYILNLKTNNDVASNLKVSALISTRSKLLQPPFANRLMQLFIYISYCSLSRVTNFSILNITFLLLIHLFCYHF